MTSPPPPTRGRPQVTDHASIEEAAFELFAEQGFEATTIDEIACAAGISRRTLFRYYPSKNDIPWGQFDASLQHLREFLASTPADVPIHKAVHRAIVDFNTFDEAVMPQHRQRMRLLLRTPALHAHSVLRHTAWRDAISEYVAERLGLRPDDLLPRTVGRVSLALALSAYEEWLEHEDKPLISLLDAALAALHEYLSK